MLAKQALLYCVHLFEEHALDISGRRFVCSYLLLPFLERFLAVSICLCKDSNRSMTKGDIEILYDQFFCRYAGASHLAESMSCTLDVSVTSSKSQIYTSGVRKLLPADLLSGVRVFVLTFWKP